MATAPKPVPKAVKAVPAAESKDDAPVAKKSKKKLWAMLAGGLVLVSAGGGAAFFFLGRSAHEGPKEVKHEPAKPPVFVVMDSFTVNLQQESGDQFLQVALTLQVADQAQVDLIKLYMPLVRSRLLLLLSSKKASEISTVDGKKKLSDDIIAQIKLPFSPGGEPQKISGVFFTSFVIQ